MELIVIGILIAVVVLLVGALVVPHIHMGGGVLLSGWIMIGNPTTAPPKPVEPIIQQQSATQPTRHIRVERVVPTAARPCPPEQFEPPVQVRIPD